MGGDHYSAEGGTYESQESFNPLYPPGTSPCGHMSEAYLTSLYSKGFKAEGEFPRAHRPILSQVAKGNPLCEAPRSAAEWEARHTCAA